MRSAFAGEHRSTHARFQHAVQARQLLNAEAAARELGRLRLADALDFLLLLSEKDPHGSTLLPLGGALAFVLGLDGGPPRP